MSRALRHRGPDGYGLARTPGAGLTVTRLAIFDLEGGWQPMSTAGGDGLIAYNGEIFNHPELRRELSARGERFQTSCDTEVVLRLLELDGLESLAKLNGQFAMAWWQPRRRRLTLARDRLGIRPLLYARLADGGLAFASEAKALFASGEISARPDLEGLDDVFTLWGAQPPRTAFAGVRQLLPGEVVVWENGEILERRSWWEQPWDGPQPAVKADFAELLADSVAIRLRADVRVGAYLSGGVDSSLIAALARSEAGERLETFSVSFADADYDERSYQRQAASHLRLPNHLVEISDSEISAAMPEVVRHAESPMVRTAPAPLYLLAERVRQEGIKAVLTGEGADELFWGYDLFKEVRLRGMHRSDPVRASALLEDLYPEMPGAGGRRGDAWKRFILEAPEPGDPFGSHATRARATSTLRALYRPEVVDQLAGNDAFDRLRPTLGTQLEQGGELDRASLLEIKTLLDPYLLAIQGDRVAMAHSVEGRYPFLDHRLVDYALALPDERKLKGMRDKAVVRDLAARMLPGGIAERPKRPYGAPGIRPFFAKGSPRWVEELLSADALEATGVWDPPKVEGLVRRCRLGRARSARESMALVGVITTQLWHDAFIAGEGEGSPAETTEPRIRVEPSIATPTEEPA